MTIRSRVMGGRLPKPSLWRNLAPFWLAASLLLFPTHPAVAADPEITAAWTQYNAGRSVTARRGLEAFLAGPVAAEPRRRLTALETLAEICVASLADQCLATAAGQFAETAGMIPVENPAQRLELARRASYYIFSGQLAGGTPEQAAAILNHPIWKAEHAYDIALYLRRQVLAANVLLRLDKPLEANRAIDKVLSLIAAVKNPRDGPSTLTWALSETIENLLVVGDTERAYGVYKATVGAISATTPPLSVEAALYELRAGILLGDMGQAEPARKYLDRAVRTIDAIELEPDAREFLLARALTELASLCEIQGDSACAEAALKRHPFAARYAKVGRAPPSFEEVRYLTVRAISAGVSRTEDATAAAALKSPLGFSADGADSETLAALRDVGQALAAPPGDQRAARLQSAAHQIRIVAQRRRDAPFGAWYRASLFDRGLVALALTQAVNALGDDGADDVFALLQLSARNGRGFDADALTALGQARNETQRRAIHQALRLRARRDAVERAALGAVAADMASGKASGGPMQQDFGVRLRFRDFSDRIAAASSDLARDGVAISGTNLVNLKQLQAVLRPDEAALTVASAPGGLVYMCVRQDSAFRRAAGTDIRNLRADLKLMTAALTAGNAPDDALDAQFPAAAAVRLYDLLIRPFAPCLRPGDHIIWLPDLGLTGFPIQALLERLPPKAAVGWDLSQAAWLARDHAVTYVAAAAAIVAQRTSPRPPQAAFDFLGAGDPLLSGVTASGEDRQKIASRGVRTGSGFAALAPLPETRDELLRSAARFTAPMVLTGAAATEAQVRRQVTGSYRYISFATHGLLRDDLQGLAEPALVFTPTASSDSMDDGLMTASEIADLNLSARFVALSACNTANFDLSQMAQDLPALASAFAVAGVPATLGTLWPVDSETGKQVVAATFEALRAGRAPAQALADAQRAFLAHPPSRARLHPRFWAPFAVMGDGGDGAAGPVGEGAAVTLGSVESIEGDGEVRVARLPFGRRLTRYVGIRPRGGRPPTLTDLSGLSGLTWRRTDRTNDYGDFHAELGDRIVVGGTLELGPERLRPTLEVLDSKTGAHGHIWRGEGISEPAAVLSGGARIDDSRAVFVVETLVLPSELETGRPKLYVFETDANLKPRLLFKIEAPNHAFINAVTVTPTSAGILYTYSMSDMIPAPATPTLVDEFDSSTCVPESLTRIELREARDGALKSAKEIQGFSLGASAKRGDKVYLGGSFRGSCVQEAHAVVLSIDTELAAHGIFQDISLGASDVRTLAPMPDGRIFVAAAKDSTVDVAAARTVDSMSPQDVAHLLYTGMVFTIDAEGEASPPTYLNAGTTILVTSSDASDPGDILLGGAIGSVPAIFHLSAHGDRARP